ncbi:hypothetical protein ABZS68_30250 [Streptomyces sp. NPDC005571]|uniref:hypothetical protein n=1 Tax=Streptomyces sp. NPDC005571 TaxID=3156888 RepID=UPI0033A2032F
MDVVHDGRPFAYIRGGRHLVVVHPRREPSALPLSLTGQDVARLVESTGVRITADTVTAEGFSFGIYDVAEQHRLRRAAAHRHPEPSPAPRSGAEGAAGGADEPLQPGRRGSWGLSPEAARPADHGRTS